MIDRFHPLVRDWFRDRFGRPTAPQAAGWEEIARGRDTLIAAPTGSGKTLAAFLWSINQLIAPAEPSRDHTHVVYVSPLKALGNDIQKNLQEPLAEITRSGRLRGLPLQDIRTAVRSGDTPATERQRMLSRPPHILITTPESLYILLTAERSRQLLKHAHTVIVDEIHAVAGDKRGAHLALSLERLDALAGSPLQRIGLSATQKPMDDIARLLVGARRLRPDGAPECAIVDVGHKRELDLSIEVPDQELGPITSHALWAEVYDRIVQQIQSHRTTLVFVHTRRLVERVAHQLTDRLGEGKVLAHHGSLSRKTRLEAEQKLKAAEVPVVVATASLELGIDIGHVELVCHIGAPRSIATLLQRVGRSGHWLGAVPKGILYPLTRDDLLQAAAAIYAVRRGELDRIGLVREPLDVLAQQMVATVASLTPAHKPGETLPLLPEAKPPSGIAEETLWELVRGAYPFRDLSRGDFEQLLHMLCEGVAPARGRRGAHLHRDRVNGMLRARRGARLVSITNGGAIPDTADYDVVEAHNETFVGKVNEDFAIESLAGDIFLLGNTSWRIQRVASGKVWVEDAHGAPPTIPFWLGEAPGRTLELSRAVSDVRETVARHAAAGADAGEAATSDREAAGAPGEPPESWLQRETGVGPAGAEQIVAYVNETRAMLGCVPTVDRIVAERFFDESGGMQLVLHTPFGGRINRAWGLALRKRFCVNFDFELQAAATDDGIVISLTDRHSFPLDTVFSYLSPATVERDLTQASLAAPMFTNRWRWNASRALAVERFSRGKKVPMQIQRMRAEDLLGAVFPDQVMCQDNRAGPVDLPDHPLTRETLENCLREAMDVDGFKETLERLGRGEIATVTVETPAPSPMAHEILNANPYAFLDDAPLEERRARAVALRRTDPDLAQGIGALSPEALAEVTAQAWPDIRDPDELHDLLLTVILLPVRDAEPWQRYAKELMAARRVTVAEPVRGEGTPFYVAAERLAEAKAVMGDFRMTPPVTSPDAAKPEVVPSPDEALRLTVQGWMEISGPITAEGLAARTGLGLESVERALTALEVSGVVLQGRFSPGAGADAPVEWCERRLLSRIHRLTLGRLRREIQPVSGADFIRFLLRWQHAQPGAQLHGRDGVHQVIRQLQGMELPAPAWEQHVLPARIAAYDPAELEHLCLAGVVTWGRLRRDTGEPEDDPSVAKLWDATPLAFKPANGKTRRTTPTRSAPLAFVVREDLPHFLDPEALDWRGLQGLSAPARDVAAYLETHGASFLADIARGTGHLTVRTERALWELVTRGQVTGDGIAGLRMLLTPELKRKENRRGGRKGAAQTMPVGRWSLWRKEDPGAPEAATETLARQLLQRYGVVFRELLARETRCPPWRLLLQAYRRMEARGEIRGGRFVNGFVGEQYALPDAVESMRTVRRLPPDKEPVIVSCTDPLNLVGILTPGPRVPVQSHQFIAYLNGTPAEIGPLGNVLSRVQPVTGSGVE
ncbi:MAG: DEAD/DEAH box helicase [Deltaproteobacteria bacterium]|nr:DEAD/DEAH box helicase [Deltaproteobacteria bacterium]